MRKFFLAAVLVLMASGAQAVMIIGGGDIVASTELPVFTDPVGTFPVEEIADGISSDTYPYNGFASTSSSGTITLELVSEYNLHSFLLWNDVNVGQEGIKDFSLMFFDGAGALIPLGFSANFSAPVGQTVSEEFIFGEVVPGVGRVDLVVLNSHPGTFNQIEIREVAFTGTVIPEPSTALLMGLGLTGLAAKGRRRIRS